MSRGEKFGFNPLKVGSYCNHWGELTVYLPDTQVSIPLKSGHIVTNIEKIIDLLKRVVVSIPLKSGHIVTLI